MRDYVMAAKNAIYCFYINIQIDLFTDGVENENLE